MVSRRLSTHSQGQINEERLRKWARDIKLANIPTNQVGGASRTAILKLIGASRSTAHSNPRIAELFQQLDARLLGETPIESTSAVAYPNEPESLRELILTLRGENAALRATVKRLQWRDDTGSSVRDL